MFEKIQKWYIQGLWKAAQVRQAVDKGMLTEEEYNRIVRDT